MTTLLEKYIAKVEEMKDGRDFTGEKWPRETQAETDGWNSALTEVQSLLPELIKEVRDEARSKIVSEIYHSNGHDMTYAQLDVLALASITEPNIK